MKRLDTLRDLFEAELNDAYSAEQQMIEALPKMAAAASSNELKKGFEEHLAQTKQQAERLEQIFEMLDIEPEHEKCDGMAGIVKDGEKMIKVDAEPHVRDAALISGAQKAEHYEIASYGTLRKFAEVLGEDEVAGILSTTLKEESRTDERLTSIAMSAANVKAPTT